jgi:hypothetical protein
MGEKNQKSGKVDLKKNLNQFSKSLPHQWIDRSIENRKHLNSYTSSAI